MDGCEDIAALLEKIDQIVAENTELERLIAAQAPFTAREWQAAYILAVVSLSICELLARLGREASEGRVAVSHKLCADELLIFLLLATCCEYVPRSRRS